MQLRLVIAGMALAAVAMAAGRANRLSASVADLSVGDQIRFFDREGTIGGGEFGVAKRLPENSPELFRTFCVQRTESLDFSSKGFIVEGIRTETRAGNDALDSKTAYLYTKFREGTLAGYTYTPNSSNHIKSANALQAALWKIEQEPGYGLGGNFSVFNALPNSVKNKANAFITAATSAISGGLWSGLGSVRIANIVWTYRHKQHKEGELAQDVLILVPEPASIVFWLSATSMVGLGAVIRRRRAGVNAT